jgi:hypothetical protein
MGQTTFDNVPVRVVRDEEQGVYVLGVVVEDAFLTFSAVKLGHGDELRQRAADDAAERREQEAQQQAEQDAARKRQMEAESQSPPQSEQPQQPQG